MSGSCPFHSFQLPLHAPVMFSVCPLHFPCMFRSFVASHFPTSPVVSIGFLVLWFPFIPPALPLFSFLSLSCPFQFPFCFRFICPCFPPLISLHFLAFPLCSPAFSRKQKHRVSSVFAQRMSNNTEFFQKPKPAKSRQGDSSLGPLFCPLFSGTSSNSRAVRIRRRAGEGLGGGVILYLLLSIRHASAMSADMVLLAVGLSALQQVLG